MSKSSSSYEIFSSTRPEKGDWPAIADKYYELDGEIDLALAAQDENGISLKSKIALHKDLRNEMQARYDQEDPNKAFEIKGQKCIVFVEARRKEATVIDMAKLLKRLTRAVFFSICKVPQKALEPHLDEEEIKKFVSWERRGYRVVKAVPLTEKRAA